MENFKTVIDNTNNTLITLRKDLENAKTQYEKPFAKEQEYQDSIAKLNKLNSILAVEGSSRIENIS